MCVSRVLSNALHVWLMVVCSSSSACLIPVCLCVAAFKGDPPRHPVLVALQAALAKQRQASSAPAAKIPSSAPAAPKLQGCGSQADSTAASSSAGPVSSSIPGLRQYHLKRMIDAREADALDTQPPLDMSGLEQYAEGTLSQVMGGFGGCIPAPYGRAEGGAGTKWKSICYLAYLPCQPALYRYQ